MTEIRLGHYLGIEDLLWTKLSDDGFQLAPANVIRKFTQIEFTGRGVQNTQTELI